MSTNEVCRKLFDVTSDALFDLIQGALKTASLVQPDSTVEDRQAHSMAMADAFRQMAIAAELGTGVRKVSDLSDYDLAVLARHGTSHSDLVSSVDAIDQACPPPGYGLDECDLTSVANY